MFSATLCLMLTACFGNNVEIHLVTPQVPAVLLQCPAPPSWEGGEATQKDVARYVALLGGAYVHCRDNLDSVRQLLEEFERMNRDN